MSSRREAERERERASRAQQQPASARTNEYFVPKDGIDREVITADICRYLGNDALVRPGNYENPQTRQVQQGYFITAYRNLTTAMIADLKADSERWDAERRQTVSRGQPSNVEYRASTTHQSRQYYGPTEAAPGANVGYPSTATASGQQGVYDNGSQYQQAYNPQVQAYAATQGYASQDNYYVAGADMAIDPRSSTRGQPIQQAGAVPRSNTVQYTSPTSTYQTQTDSRNTYYSQVPTASTQAYTSQPADPFYGRAGTYGDSSGTDVYGYQDTSPYNQASTSSAPSSTVPPASSRRERDRDERDSRHRRR